MSAEKQKSAAPQPIWLPKDARHLQSLFDWAAMAVFAGLVVLFLQRSISEHAVDRIYHYAPPAVGCATANYVGNLGVDSNRTDLQLFAGVILIACVAYIIHILRPLPLNKDRN